MMSKTFTWGIIGTGSIAATFAQCLKQSKTGQLIAVASRTQKSAQLFADIWDIPRCYQGYDTLLADKDVQIVYISTPHAMHTEWVVKAAAAGKHILCEKPLGLSYADALVSVEAAQRNRIFLLEAFMYRFHPQTYKLIELLREEVIGKVQVIQATFAIKPTKDITSRLFDNALGGGSIMDVGCYCTSFARLVAGIATGQNFAEPISVAASGYIGDSQVDEYTAAVLKFPDGIIAQLFCSLQTNAGIHATIYGSKGSIQLSVPFTPIPAGKQWPLVIKLDGQKEKTTLLTMTDVPLYTLEADAVAYALPRLEAPDMTLQDTLGNMRTLDKWRHAIGMEY